MILKGLLLCVLLASLTCVSSSEAAQSRWQKLINKNAQGALLSLSSKTLQSLARDARNYSVIIYFGSKPTDKQYKCEFCKIVEPQFKNLFGVYRQYLGRRGYDSQEFAAHPIFFARCEIPDCLEAASQSGLTSIPQIVELPMARRASQGSKIDVNIYEITQKITPHAVAVWIQERTGQLIMTEPFIDKYNREIAMAGTFILLLILIPKVYARRKDPMIWFAASVCVYLFVMSGSIYNAIRGTPFWHQSQDGSIMFFYPSSRDQFIVEGYIMAVFLTGMGMLVVALSKVQELDNPWAKRILVLVIITALTTGFNTLRLIVRRKYGHYPV